MSIYQHDIFPEVFYRVHDNGPVERKDTLNDWHPSVLKPSDIVKWFKEVDKEKQDV